MADKAKGCKLSKIDLRDYKIKAGAGINLPVSYELQFNHNIKNQGAVASCVAHSTSEILEYYSKINMSTNFIYTVRDKVCNDTGFGMHLADACKIVQKYGDMTNDDCPGNIEAPRCFEQTETFLNSTEKLNKAYEYRIDSYYKCNSNADVKMAIMNYGPVLAAIKWYDQYTVQNGVIEFNTNGSFGYHAIMIYGWNEQGFLFQNSWGKSFGNTGCAVLPYQYKIAEARALIDHDNTKDDINVHVPTQNKVTDKFYKALNTIINFVLRRK